VSDPKDTPTTDFTPPVISNTGNSPVGGYGTVNQFGDAPLVGEGYHNIEQLQSDLTTLQSETLNTMAWCDQKLSQYSLRIGVNAKLAEAQEAEWPTTLSDPKDYISWNQYKSLELNETRGAMYIKKCYEDYMRGPAGCTCLDVYHICSLMHDEASHIKDFLDAYVGDINDSSEYRVLELFQDWTQFAIVSARQFRSIYNAETTLVGQIPDEELSQITEDQASQFQALFKGKVNAINIEIERLQQAIQKDNVEHTLVFFNNFLGPALKFRNKVGKDLAKSIPPEGFLSSQANETLGAYDASFFAALTDMMRRNGIMHTKLNDLVARVSVRNQYNATIRQLETLGKSIKSPFANVEVPTEEIEHFSQLTAIKAAEAKNLYVSGHSSLDDIDNPLAHPQYLLKDGDTITGDITVADGVKIDGMNLKTHRHRGLAIDGSDKIHGSDIVGSSVTSDLVDTTEVISPPVNLRVLSQSRRVVPPGVTNVSALLAWDTLDPNLLYEVQLVAIDNSEIDYYVDFLADRPNTLPVSGPLHRLASGVRYLAYSTTQAFVDTETQLARVYRYEWETGVTTLAAQGPFAVPRDITQDYSNDDIFVLNFDSKVYKITGTTCTEIATVAAGPRIDLVSIECRPGSSPNEVYVGYFDNHYNATYCDKLTYNEGDEVWDVTSEFIVTLGKLVDMTVDEDGSVYLILDDTEAALDPDVDDPTITGPRRILKTNESNQDLELDNVDYDPEAIEPNTAYPTRLSVSEINEIFVVRSTIAGNTLSDYSYIEKITIGDTATPTVTSTHLAGKLTGADLFQVDGDAIDEAEFVHILDIASVVDGFSRHAFSSDEENRIYILDQSKLRVYHVRKSMNLFPR